MHRAKKATASAIAIDREAGLGAVAMGILAVDEGRAAVDG
jgi:hypothetical protein